MKNVNHKTFCRPNSENENEKLVDFQMNNNNNIVEKV